MLMPIPGSSHGMMPVPFFCADDRAGVPFLPGEDRVPSLIPAEDFLSASNMNIPTLPTSYEEQTKNTKVISVPC